LVIRGASVTHPNRELRAFAGRQKAKGAAQLIHGRENKMQQRNTNHQSDGIWHWRMPRIAASAFAVVAMFPLPALAQEPNPLLPHNLSPWGMFLSADIVVKGVMVGLAFASFVTWTVWLAKTIELQAAKNLARRRLAMLERGVTLSDAVRACETKRDAVAQLITSTAREAELSDDIIDDGFKERVALRLERVEAAMARRLSRGVGILATIGATAPFVGLFGTVWGIMNSFIGISESHTTNLAVVAPGIAEALLATAFGLVAAIPAVVIYNHLARVISGYRTLLGDASAQLLLMVSRGQLRRAAVLPRAAE
jgi:biopolymer transport protein ExbB